MRDADTLRLWIMEGATASDDDFLEYLLNSLRNNRHPTLVIFSGVQKLRLGDVLHHETSLCPGRAARHLRHFPCHKYYLIPNGEVRAADLANALPYLIQPLKRCS